MLTLLFVYGTLKRNGEANRILLGQQYISEAVTEPKYRLYDFGSYPGMVHDKTNGLTVHGELWYVDDICLLKLDKYEEVPDLFVREQVAVQGIKQPVETYIYNGLLPKGLRSGHTWPLTKMME
jgi:gamma-glutamylaminecyclotransferase